MPRGTPPCARRRRASRGGCRSTSSCRSSSRPRLAPPARARPAALSLCFRTGNAPPDGVVGESPEIGVGVGVGVGVPTNADAPTFAERVVHVVLGRLTEPLRHLEHAQAQLPPRREASPSPPRRPAPPPSRARFATCSAAWSSSSASASTPTPTKSSQSKSTGSSSSAGERYFSSLCAPPRCPRPPPPRPPRGPRRAPPRTRARSSGAASRHRSPCRAACTARGGRTRTPAPRGEARRRATGGSRRNKHRVGRASSFSSSQSAKSPSSPTRSSSRASSEPLSDIAVVKPRACGPLETAHGSVSSAIPTRRCVLAAAADPRDCSF